MNIILDVDDVVLNFYGGYAKRYNCSMPKRWSNSQRMADRLAELKKDKSFWIHLEAKHIPDFTPTHFVSARSLPVAWTTEALKRHNIPGRSKVIHVGWGQSKINTLRRLGCDIFIDDKWQTVKECNANGIFCLLMDACHNRHIKTKYRIHNLEYENIMHLWRKLKQ
jgi:uncharacterized HAD superfamily protein